jgi:hypothetical protein
MAVSFMFKLKKKGGTTFEIINPKNQFLLF